MRRRGEWKKIPHTGKFMGRGLDARESTSIWKNRRKFVIKQTVGREWREPVLEK